MPLSIHLFEHNSPKNCLVIFGVAIGLFDIQLYLGPSPLTNLYFAYNVHESFYICKLIDELL